MEKSEHGKVGSYAVSTIDFDTWARSPISQKSTPTKGRKTKHIKEIVYPLFEECKALVQDPFWADKFNTAAYGRLPRGFSYNEYNLSYKKGARTFSIELSQNPMEAAYAAMEFFRVNAGIFSPMDVQRAADIQIERSQQVVEDLAWGDVNKRVQECMLSNYVIEKQNTMQLTIPEREHLREVIKLGIGDKYFGKHNITLLDNRISNIGGLQWNADTRRFTVDAELKPINARTGRTPIVRESSCPMNDTVPQFHNKWIKYVDALEKKANKYMRRKKTIHNVNGKKMDDSTEVTSATDITDATDE